MWIHGRCAKLWVFVLPGCDSRRAVNPVNHDAEVYVVDALLLVVEAQYVVLKRKMLQLKSRNTHSHEQR